MEPSSYPRPILDNIKDKHSKIPTLFSLSMPVLCVFLQILACFYEILYNFLYEFRKKNDKIFPKTASIHFENVISFQDNDEWSTRDIRGH